MLSAFIDDDVPTRAPWLVDGGEHQLGCVLEFCGRHGGTSTVIVDVIHVLEYLWNAGRALFGEGTPESERWVTEQLGTAA